MIKACLFDMDGVIVDTAKFHFLAWQRLAHSLSIEFTEVQNEELKGVSRVESLEKILSWGGVELDSAKKLDLMELKNAWYLEYAEQVNPAEMLPGVLDFLNELQQQNIRIGLGSSSKNAVLILEKLGIYSMGVEAAKTGGFYCIGIGDATVLSMADAVVKSMEGMTVEKMKELVASDE